KKRLNNKIVLMKYKVPKRQRH
ncbi:TPA: hypothetical protein ACN1TH_002870, partial [Staphylococcus aureus]